MIIRESASQTCPRCRRRFRVLADEVGTHPCPHCGWEPYSDIDVFEDEDYEEEDEHDDD